MTLFAGQVVLVTGAGGRIGSAICRGFAREGAKVACCDIDADRAVAVAKTIQGTGAAAVAVRGDVAVESQVEMIVYETTRLLGPVDILVNCAAIFPNCPVVEMNVAEWDRVFAVNLRGPMLLCRTVVRQMLGRGAKGNIVNISSPEAELPHAGGAHYSGSKAALNILTRTLAIELGPSSIRVNSVAPGLVLDAVRTLDNPPEDEYSAALLKGIPVGRTADSDEIARAVLYLANNEWSSFVHGAILSVTGGADAGRAYLPPSRQIRAMGLGE